MPNVTAWIGGRSRLRAWRNSDVRTAGVANIIADKPAQNVILIRKGIPLTAQTVRIDVFGSISSERMSMGSNAQMNAQKVLVLGYRGHPTIPDTDIQTMDEFAFDGQYYRVLRVESAFTDRVEALAEATE